MGAARRPGAGLRTHHPEHHAGPRAGRAATHRARMDRRRGVVVLPLVAGRRAVSEADEARLAPLLAGGDISADGRWRAASARGDLYLIDRVSGGIRRLTETEDAEANPRFSADGGSVFFRRGMNLFALDLQDASVRQLTRIASGPKPPEEPEPEGQKAFLEAQQEELFEHIRVEKLREERAKERQERLDAEEPETLYLAADESAEGLDIDPAGRFVAVTAVRPATEAERAEIPVWVTESGYTETDEVRAKVGDEQSRTRIALIRTETGEATWLDLSEPGSADDAGGEEGPAGEGSGDALALATFVGWNDTGTHGLVFAVDADFKTWRLYALESESGELTLLDRLHDEAWVGGPCFPNFGPVCMGWYPSDAPVSADGPRAWYVSEATGWAHLYAIDADGTDREQLTSGEWEVQSAGIPEGWDAFLLHTSETSPFDAHPWRMAFDGSSRERLVDGPGLFRAVPAPGGGRVALVHSRSNRPPEVFLADLEPASSPEQVTVTPTAEWLGFPWIEPEIIRFEARDGVGVPARIYRPRDFGVPSNGAGVVFVHGAGYLHNVHHGWSSYYHEYMFHHVLAARGYTVLDIDYRGSAGYGRAWRTAIYRHMGGWDLSDQVDGAAYLVDHEGVDPKRIGVYGGSYGGFITLMAMFTEPGTFAAGAALRSVTDWAHYNHWYTSRILNLPQDDEEAYRQSSPIYFAEGLEGHLQGITFPHEVPHRPRGRTSTGGSSLCSRTSSGPDAEARRWEAAADTRGPPGGAAPGHGGCRPLGGCVWTSIRVAGAGRRPLAGARRCAGRGRGVRTRGRAGHGGGFRQPFFRDEPARQRHPRQRSGCGAGRLRRRRACRCVSRRRRGAERALPESRGLAVRGRDRARAGRPRGQCVAGGRLGGCGR